MLPKSYHDQYGLRLYLPLILLVVLIVGEQAFPRIVPAMGMPLIFTICAAVTPFTGRRFQPLVASREAMGAALPVMGILAGVGMFLQIMALTGGRGFMVSMLVGLPLALLYISIGISMPRLRCRIGLRLRIDPGGAVRSGPAGIQRDPGGLGTVTGRGHGRPHAAHGPGRPFRGAGG